MKASTPVWMICAALLASCANREPKINNYLATLPSDIPEPNQANGAIFQSGYEVPLFQNSVAHRVGDVLTITLSEKTAAAKSATTDTSKKHTVDMASPTIAGGGVTVNGRDILSASLDNASTFAGSGDSTQKNELTGNISVTVAKRLANGNLVVRGQKWISLNQGSEYLRIAGIVRPTDISPDNSVPSYKVADATISYGGRGTLAESNTKSWLARFFDSKWVPF
ncbi:MAG: flagellar basal body L-ring protein FlgH [Steroidobacteraceae bacterium]